MLGTLYDIAAKSFKEKIAMKHTITITIAHYDPQWPILYEEEKARILGVIGDKVVAIEHIGSTAVPGLGAKPIIDITVAVRHLADAEKCIEPLQSVGYEYVPEYEVSIPERRYFRKALRKHIGIYTWLNKRAISGSGSSCFEIYFVPTPR